MRRRNQFPRPNSIMNSLRAELRLYFQGVGPDRGVQGKYSHPAPESKFIRQRVQGVLSLSKILPTAPHIYTRFGLNYEVNKCWVLREDEMRPQGTPTKGAYGIRRGIPSL